MPAIESNFLSTDEVLDPLFNSYSRVEYIINDGANDWVPETPADAIMIILSPGAIGEGTVIQVIGQDGVRTTKFVLNGQITKMKIYAAFANISEGEVIALWH